MNGGSVLCKHSLLVLWLCGSFLTTFADRISYRGGEPLFQLRQGKERLQRYFDEKGHEQKKLSGRGIVIPAGGRTHLTNVFVVAKVIRGPLNSSLPIEVHFHGAKETDSEIFIKLREIPGLSLRDASLLPRPAYLKPWPKHLHGYAKKVFSLYSTAFEQVLLLDSDNQPLVKPDALFEHPAFKQSGAVFWPDYWKANTALEAPKPGAYSILGLREPWQHHPDWACVESGQVLFDKSRHSDALDWVMWINLRAKIMYQYVLGDKDTFEMGFMLAWKHAQFFRIPTPPRTALSRELRGFHTHVGMVASMDGYPLFLHRTSGGKFDVTKPAKSHFRPSFLTEPMSVAAAKQFLWDVSLAVNLLPAAAAATFLPSCGDLSQDTQTALRHVVATQKVNPDALKIARQYSECSVHHKGDTGIPIPALQIPVYGHDLVQAIDYSYVAFQELRDALGFI